MVGGAVSHYRVTRGGGSLAVMSARAHSFFCGLLVPLSFVSSEHELSYSCHDLRMYVSCYLVCKHWRPQEISPQIFLTNQKTAGTR